MKNKEVKNARHIGSAIPMPTYRKFRVLAAQNDLSASAMLRRLVEDAVAKVKEVK